MTAQFTCTLCLLRKLIWEPEIYVLVLVIKDWKMFHLQLFLLHLRVSHPASGLWGICKEETLSLLLLTSASSCRPSATVSGLVVLTIRFGVVPPGECSMKTVCRHEQMFSKRHGLFLGLVLRIVVDSGADRMSKFNTDTYFSFRRLGGVAAIC